MTEGPDPAVGTAEVGLDVSPLESERDFLFASLADLEAERSAGELDEAAYRSLHDEYTARTASVLRALEAALASGSNRSVPGLAGQAGNRTTSAGGAAVGSDRRRSAGPPSVRPSGAPGRRRRLVLTLVVVLAIAGAAVGSVLAFAGNRPAGQALSGSLPTDPETTDPIGGSAGPPSGVVARAIELERKGDAVGALKAYDEVLRAKPDDVEALAYRGWLLKRAGLPDRALDSLDRAVAADPTYPDAHFFRGMVLYQDRKDPAAAVAEFRLFLANDPPASMVPLVENVLRRAEADATSPAPQG